MHRWKDGINCNSYVKQYLVNMLGPAMEYLRSTSYMN